MNNETQSMKALTHEQLMAKVLSDYTAKVVAEERRRQQVREQVANGTYVPAPVCQSDNWNISDRH